MIIGASIYWPLERVTPVTRGFPPVALLWILVTSISGPVRNFAGDRFSTATLPVFNTANVGSGASGEYRQRHLLCAPRWACQSRDGL